VYFQQILLLENARSSQFLPLEFHRLNFLLLLLNQLLLADQYLIDRFDPPDIASSVALSLTRLERFNRDIRRAMFDIGLQFTLQRGQMVQPGLDVCMLLQFLPFKLDEYLSVILLLHLRLERDDLIETDLRFDLRR
jgi:hypothetical protein